MEEKFSADRSVRQLFETNNDRRFRYSVEQKVPSTLVYFSTDVTGGVWTDLITQFRKGSLLRDDYADFLKDNEPSLSLFLRDNLSNFYKQWKELLPTLDPLTFVLEFFIWFNDAIILNELVTEDAQGVIAYDTVIQMSSLLEELKITVPWERVKDEEKYNEIVDFIVPEYIKNREDVMILDKRRNNLIDYNISQLIKYYQQLPLKWSKPNITTAYRVYDIKEKTVMTEDGVQGEGNSYVVFDQAQLNKFVPYIFYSNRGHEYHKIYNGSDLAKNNPSLKNKNDDEIKLVNYNKITNLSRSPERLFPFSDRYMLIQALKKESSLDYYNEPNNSFIRIIVNLDRNVGKLMFKWENDYMVAETGQVDTTGKSDIIRLIQSSLPTVDISPTYTHLNMIVSYETQLPAAISMDTLFTLLNWDPLFSRYFFIDESRRPYSQATTNYLYFRFDDTDITEKKTRGVLTLSTDNKLRVNVTGLNQNRVEHYLLFFQALLGAYYSKEEVINNLYRQVLGSITTTVKVKELERGYKLSDFFGTDYTHDLCTSGGKPELIFNPDLLERYKVPVYHRGNLIQRDIVPLSNYVTDKPDEVKGWLVCPKANKPYLNDKEKADGRVVPCCGATRMPKRPYVARQVRSGEARTFKILSPGVSSQIAVIPNIVGLNNLQRIGIVDHRGDSFLYCIAYLVDPNYRNDPVGSVTRLRKRLIDETYPALYRQEMHDRNDEEIKMGMINDIFVDPLLYYRGIEVLFGLSVYVFENDNKTGEIRPIFPHFQAMYGRPYYERPCFLILRNWTNLTDFPQCEILYANGQAQFGPETNLSCWVYLQNSYLQLFRPHNDLNTYRNVFSQPTLAQLPYGRQHLLAHSQYIDAYGKTRGFYYTINESKVDFMLVVPPCQPVNLPNRQNIIRISYNQGIKLMGNQYTNVSLKGGKTIGLWYRINNIDNLVYLPIEPTTIEERKEKDLSCDLDINTSQPSSLVNQYVTLQKKIDLFLALFDRFLNIYLQEELGTDITSYLQVTNKDEQYDFSMFKWLLLPTEEKRVDEYLKKVSHLCPTFCSDRVIYVYNDKFYQRLLYYIRKYVPSHKDNDPHILYHYGDDFTESKTSFVLTDADYNRWSVGHQQLGYRVSHGELFLSTSIYPYLIGTENGKIYLVQNVKNDNFYHAYHTSLNYYQRRKLIPVDIINTTLTVGYKIYQHDGYNLILSYDGSQGQKPFIRILTYNKVLTNINNDRFAAMIEIV